MHFQTLNLSAHGIEWRITLQRTTARNSINTLMLQELHEVLRLAANDESCRLIVLRGEQGYFCTGMDFTELVNSDQKAQADFSEQYMQLLKIFAATDKIIISVLDGQVLAGGMGLVAASDLVLSTSQSQFGLSEALWGLLPACVLPYLIRRVGFQKAYYLTLTTQTITAERAYQIGLIDELHDDIETALQRLSVRLGRVSAQTVKDLKAYMQKMWIMNETMEVTALNELRRLSGSETVQKNISNFLEFQRFPWENVEG